jgi:hypothetical protein
MGLTQNLGRLSPSIFSDASLNIGVGAAPSGSYKFEVTGTSKVSGVLTLGSTLSNGTYTYTLPAATGTLALVGGAGVGTVTSVAALTLGTTGTDLSSTVATSTTTPVITLNVPTASATNRGALSSADWTTFNNKQGTITLTTTGTSGAATFSANTLNIPNYGSALSGYLPLTGGTLTGALGGTSAVFSSSVDAGGDITATNTQNGTSTIRLNNTNSGSSANARLLLVSDSGNAQIKAVSSTNVTYVVGDAMVLNADTMSGGMLFAHNDSVKMTLNTSGNLGLGVTPESWFSGYKVLQVNNFSVASYLNSSVYLGHNYYTNTSGNDIYRNNGFATNYAQFNGNHAWYNAPSGTAGAAITFTQAMTLFSDGNLLLTNSTVSNAGYKLDVNGTGRFSSQLFVSYSGSADTLVVTSSGSANGIGLRNRTGDDYSFFNWRNNSGTELLAEQYLQRTAANTAIMRYTIANGGSPATYLTIASTGAATFSSTISATNASQAIITANYNGSNRMEMSANGFNLVGGNNFTIQQAGGASQFTLNYSTGAATFSSTITSQSGNGTTYLSNTSATTGSISQYVGNNGANLRIGLEGNTGGVICAGSTLYDACLVYNGGHNFNISMGAATPALVITSGGNVLIGTTTDDTVNKLQVNGNIAINKGAGNTAIFDTNNTRLSLALGGTANFTNFSGMILVNSYQTGSFQILVCGGGSTASVYLLGGAMGTLAYNAGINGYTYTITAAATSTYNFTAFRTRPDA